MLGPCLFVFGKVEQPLQLDLLLFARIDEPDLGTDLGGEQLDHVVAQRLGGGDHLTLLHEEPDHVSRSAVDAWADIEWRR